MKYIECNCPNCDGKGVVYSEALDDYTTCELCEGSGEAIAFDDED